MVAPVRQRRTPRRSIRVRGSAGRTTEVVREADAEKARADALGGPKHCVRGTIRCAVRPTAPRVSSPCAVGQVEAARERRETPALHAWSPAFPFASSEGGKWADLLPSEGDGSKEPLDRSSLPLCRRVREGGPTAARQIGEASRQLQSATSQ
jgi:hypothetical protein